MNVSPKIFEFDCYKAFVTQRIQAMPSEGRGQYKRLAEHINVHTSFISQVFRGDKHLTLEQGYLLADSFGLDEEETDYLLTCIVRDRAGTQAMRRFYDRKLKAMRSKWERPSSRVKPQATLQEEDKSEFYSQWYVSAIRLLTSIEKYQSPEAVGAQLNLSPRLVGEVVRFLLSRGLCELKDGRLVMKVARTHVPADSPHVLRHHLNWRVKALECLPRQKEPFISFTCPFTAGEADRQKLRRLTSQFIGEFSRIVDESPAEELSCLNLDWFKV